MFTFNTYILGMYKTNCYMINANGNAIIIDPADKSEYLLNKLNEKGLNLCGILLTHAHFDHMMAAEELRRATGAPLCVHINDKEGVIDADKSYLRQLGRLSHGFNAPDVLFADGDEFPFDGVNATVFYTPGHTKGSCCYIIEKDIFCGDLVFKDGFGRCDLYGGDQRELVSSIARLREFFEENGTDYVLHPGHGDKLYADDFMKKTNYFTY